MAATDKEREEFIAVLKHFSMFQPLSQYKVLCPFHGDKNPSMLINLDEAKYFCFGCQAHGTTYDLVKAFYPRYNSFQIISTIKKISLGCADEQKQKYINVEPKKLNINAARDYYYNLPKVNWFSRDIDAEAKQYMKKRGFKMSTLNMIGARINATDNYKIVLPLLDNGVFRGYVARTTKPEIEEKRKYLYNSGFRRSKTLAGNYTGETVLVVEGYLDMLKAMQYGVKNVVAVLGWKMSEQQQQKLLHRGVKTIVCGLDNDEAGRKGYKYLQSLNKFEVIRLKYPVGIKDFGDINLKRLGKKFDETLYFYDLL